MKKPILFYGRDLLNQKEVERADFIYLALGKVILENGGSKQH